STFALTAPTASAALLLDAPRPTNDQIDQRSDNVRKQNDWPPNLLFPTDRRFFGPAVEQGPKPNHVDREHDRRREDQRKMIDVDVEKCLHNSARPVGLFLSITNLRHNLLVGES